jgi:hypothetical protein
VKSPQGGRPKKRVQALYAYEAAADTELDMRENDIITVHLEIRIYLTAPQNRKSEPGPRA